MLARYGCVVPLLRFAAFTCSTLNTFGFYHSLTVRYGYLPLLRCVCARYTFTTPLRCRYVGFRTPTRTTHFTTTSLPAHRTMQLVYRTLHTTHTARVHHCRCGFCHLLDTTTPFTARHSRFTTLHAHTCVAVPNLVPPPGYVGYTLLRFPCHVLHLPHALPCPVGIFWTCTLLVTFSPRLVACVTFYRFTFSASLRVFSHVCTVWIVTFVTGAPAFILRTHVTAIYLYVVRYHLPPPLLFSRTTPYDPHHV